MPSAAGGYVLTYERRDSALGSANTRPTLEDLYKAIQVRL
jgi:hypothetical protein